MAYLGGGGHGAMPLDPTLILLFFAGLEHGFEKSPKFRFLFYFLVKFYADHI